MARTFALSERYCGAAGERVFDVAVNGKVVLNRVDIFSLAGGPLKAVDRTIRSRSEQGVLLIEFRPIKGQALVSAISIAPLDGSAAGHR